VTVETSRADATLVRAACDGDHDAFAALYDRYADPLFDFALGVLRDRHEAEDVVQETFLVAARRMHQLRDAEKVRAWLYAIARHEAVHRATDRRRRRPEEDVGDASAVEEPGPAASAERRELERLVREAESGLVPRDRVVLELGVRRELDGQELADALGVRRDHAYTLVANARKRLEKALGALLVARAGRRNCDELAGLLGDWDGRLDPRVRKRVARHVESCSTCAETRARTMSPAALLAAAPLVPAPALLRDRVLGQAAVVEPVPAGSGSDDGFPTGLGRSRLPFLVASTIGIAVVVAAAVVMVAFVGGDSGDPEAAEVTARGPSAPASTSPAPRDYCVVAAELRAALGTTGPASPAPADVEAYFRTWVEHLEEMELVAAEQTPPDVAAATTTLRAGLSERLAAGSLTSLPAAAAALDAPELEAASERIEAYVTSECA